jgi:hypothetical protein
MNRSVGRFNIINDDAIDPMPYHENKPEQTTNVILIGSAMDGFKGQDLPAAAINRRPEGLLLYICCVLSRHYGRVFNIRT